MDDMEWKDAGGQDRARSAHGPVPTVCVGSVGAEPQPCRVRGAAVRLAVATKGRGSVTPAGPFQNMCWPPLMAILAPVTKAASSDAR